jgi:hypothetical protein
MRNSRGSLRRIGRRAVLRAEADQVVNALTLLLVAASVAPLGSLIV